MELNPLIKKREGVWRLMVRVRKNQMGKREDIIFEGFKFFPVIKLPKDYEVFDFTQDYDPNRKLNGLYGVGKFNEERPTMYESDQYKTESEPRTVHMGIDIAAPVGESIHAFYDGEVYSFGYNSLPLDYGHTLITKHLLNDTHLYVLHGHLSAESIIEKKPGQKFNKGDVIGWVGDRHENGGWNPHLHFQLSLQEPQGYDLPGVIAPSQRPHYLKIFLDPQLVLGKLY